MTKRYSAYKDSGIEWIGEIPEHWEVLKAKYLFAIRNDRDHSDEPLLSVTQRDSLVKREELETRVWNPESDVSAYKLVKVGDFVISLRTFEGGIELSQVQGVVSPAYTVLERKIEIGELYYKFLLKSHNFIIELNKVTTGIRQGKNISYDDFAEIELPIPTLIDQEVIGSVLTVKTGIIDRLIAAKEKRIELLKEQRTALINHAVTKGLDPSVKMKDSGIEWIGEIPEHWKLKKLKYLGKISSGDSISADMFGDEFGYPVYGGNGVMGYYQEFNYSHDVIGIGRVGEKCGNVHLITEKCWINDNSLVLDIEEPNVSLRFLSHQLTVRDLNSLRNQNTQPLITGTMIKNVSVALPETAEQQQIVTFLDEETQKIDSLMSLEQKKIDLLKEYRQALISEAVTGKIKVTKE